MTPFVETKRTLDGREQRFETLLLARTRSMAAVRFDFTGTTYARAGGFEISAGSYTTGFFWRNRTYNLYHITRADGSPIADRFDVVEGVRIGRAGLRFTDLLLDLWVSPLGEARFEDEDEVREYRERGLMTDRQFATVERTGRYLARNHQRVVAAALAELEAARRRAQNALDVLAEAAIAEAEAGRTFALRDLAARDGIDLGTMNDDDLVIE